MKLLIDTNVVLDVLLRREPYFEYAAKLQVLSEKGYIRNYVSASAVTDTFYIAKRALNDKKEAIDLLRKFLKTVHIASVTESNIYEALELQWSDFEDSVQYTVGKRILANYIITRNPKDFSKGHIKIMSPKEFIKQIVTNER